MELEAQCQQSADPILAGGDHKTNFHEREQRIASQESKHERQVFLC